MTKSNTLKTGVTFHWFASDSSNVYSQQSTTIDEASRNLLSILAELFTPKEVGYVADYMKNYVLKHHPEYFI